jgi:TrmH family RNA methyltransferase
MPELTVVLCRVRESGNVGSICRAMKTMGVESLSFAGCPEYDEATVRMMAVHAFDLYERAARFASLEEALAGQALSAGFSRRVGERRKGFSLPLRDFVADVERRPAAPAALVFGNEKDGLTDRELGLCSLAVHIPTSDAFPSLNVAQAVQIACYEFFAARSGEAAVPARLPLIPASRAEIDAQISEIVEALAAVGFFNKGDDSHVHRFLRDLCERGAATAGEISFLRKIFVKAAALSSRPSRPGKGT